MLLGVLNLWIVFFIPASWCQIDPVTTSSTAFCGQRASHVLCLWLLWSMYTEPQPHGCPWRAVIALTWCSLSVNGALFSFLCHSHLKKLIKRKGLRQMPRKRAMSQGMTPMYSPRSIQKTSSREQKFWQVRCRLPMSILPEISQKTESIHMK